MLKIAYSNSSAEAQDFEMVNLILHKYSRLFNFPLSKYSGADFISKNHSKSTIERLTGKMTDTKYIKVLRNNSILETKLQRVKLSQRRRIRSFMMMLRSKKHRLQEWLNIKQSEEDKKKQEQELAKRQQSKER